MTPKSKTRKLRIPKAVYVAIQRDTGQVIELDTNRAECIDKANTLLPRDEIAIVRYVPDRA